MYAYIYAYPRLRKSPRFGLSITVDWSNHINKGSCMASSGSKASQFDRESDINEDAWTTTAKKQCVIDGQVSRGKVTKSIWLNVWHAILVDKMDGSIDGFTQTIN